MVSQGTSRAQELKICAPASSGEAADATEAVNSRPVATAHPIIDDAAVGGGGKRRQDFERGQLITLSLTAIYCRGWGGSG